MCGCIMPRGDFDPARESTRSTQFLPMTNDKLMRRLRIVIAHVPLRITIINTLMTALIMATSPCALGAVDVIFLDMDGVMLPFGEHVFPDENGSNLFPSSTLAALSLIMEEIPSVVLVLSSTWRVRPEYCDDIIANFQLFGEKHGGPLATIQQFYDVTNVHTHTERSWEIHDWLSLNKNNVRAWIALDDEELVEGECNERHRREFEDRVIKTQSDLGLTTENARQAIALLRQQIEALEGNR